jgi:hypothetical protein
VKLTDLDPFFLRFNIDAQGNESHQRFSALTVAQGVMFYCPKCYDKPNEHRLIVWFNHRDVSPFAQPANRWEFSGNDFSDLTLSPSVDVTEGCRWHGFVINGQMTNV